MTNASRLERAMDLFLRCQEQGLDRNAAIAANPDVADLLTGLFGPVEDGAGDAAGARRFGDYELGEELGRGGMGVVFAARHRSLDRRVALKVLDDSVAANPTLIARLRREALTMARLDHPHIVRVHDVGEADGRHWLAMELVDGESLDQRLRRLRAASHDEQRAALRPLLEAIVQVATALQHVHDAGVLHRDVKPSNVLLRADGRALLSDFGLARDDRAPGVTQQGVLAGTPHYMSPEHIAGGPLDARSDVFSLGATLYEVLTLRRPFDAASTDLVLRNILLQDPADPRRLRPTLPADLAAIVLKAIEKEPARRYQSARAFGEDLAAFLELRAVQARAPSTVQRVRRWARREPWKAALAASLLACAGLGAYLLAQLPSLRAADLAQREAEYEAAITAGDLARQALDRPAAMAAFDRARALFPDRPQAEVWRCLSLLGFDGPAAALAELERTCGMSSADEGVERLRASLFRWLGRNDEATALERRLGAPVTPDGMMLTAASLLQQNRPGDEARAQQLMSLAVRTSKHARLFLYVCWAGIAPPEQRQECASSILALWPDVPVALQQAAMCLRDIDPRRAMELQRRVVENQDRGHCGSTPHFFLASFAFRAGEHATAVAAARDALAKDVLPDDLRTNLIARIESVDAALAAAEAAAWLEREPRNAHAAALRARQLAAAGDLAGAAALLDAALAERPDAADLRTQRGRVHLKQGESGPAAAAAGRVLAAVPDHAGAHALLVAALRQGGDRDALRAELRRWTALRRTDAAAWSDLAAALLADPPDAAAALGAANEADWLAGGKDEAALELRARAHEALAEHAAAALCRERARLAAADAAVAPADRAK